MYAINVYEELAIFTYFTYTYPLVNDYFAKQYTYFKLCVYYNLYLIIYICTYTCIYI